MRQILKYLFSRFIFLLNTNSTLYVFPNHIADITDRNFSEFLQWQKRKTTRTPKDFQAFTPRILRLFRRLMEIKPSKRYPVTEVNKYLGDRWLMNRSPRTSSVNK